MTDGTLRCRIAVLGDTHFGRTDAAVVAMLAQDLRAQAPDAVVLAGDLTQRARTREFRQARTFLDALPAPTLAVPGNHDLPLYNVAARMMRPYAGYRRHIHAELEPTLLLPCAAVLGVDSTHRLSHKRGRLGQAAIERAVRRLRRHPRPFRIVVVHQPLAREPGAGHELVRGAGEALDRWLAEGADLILGGHVHRGYCLEVGSRRRGLLVQTGTAVSTRLRGGIPNSYYLLAFEQLGDGVRRIRVDRRDHDAQRRRFATAAIAVAEEQAGGWSLHC